MDRSAVRPLDEAVLGETVLLARRSGAPRARHAWEARTVWRARRGKSVWTRTDVIFLGALFGIFILNVLDITVTLLHTGEWGWDTEGNAVIRAVAETGGPWMAVVAKLAVIVIAVAVMWRLFRDARVALRTARTRAASRRAGTVLRTQMIATSGLFLLYAWVVQHNLRIVW